MRLLSFKHARYWLAPMRWPEAARRIVRARRGARWCRSRAVPTPASDLLEAVYADELAAARTRVAASGVRLGGGGNTRLLYDLCEETAATRVIETGIAYGWSSLAILLSIHPRDGHLWSTDLSYAHTDSGPAVGVAVPSTLRKHWTMLAGPDDTEVPRAVAAAATIDLAHYDSAKTPDAMFTTCMRLWDAIRPGGILMVDDIGDHLGFRDLAHALAVEPTVVRFEGKYQGILRKP